MRRSIRGGMGLGDALYVQSVVRHLVEKGESLKVCTAWPDVFRQLGPNVSVAPFTRQVQILAHYSTRKQKAGTTQFEDCCYTAGIRDPVELRLDWRVEDEAFVSRLKDAAAGRAIVLLGMPRAPMGRKDGFGAEVLPNCAVIQKAVDRLKEEKGALIVQIGSGESLHAFRRRRPRLGEQDDRRPTARHLDCGRCIRRLLLVRGASCRVAVEAGALCLVAAGTALRHSVHRGDHADQDPAEADVALPGRRRN
jgi:hypothetical protein